MIWESGYWKQDLLKDAAIIERWASKTPPSEKQSVILEKKIFLSAYTIRKLFENYKVSDSIKSVSTNCTLYPYRGDSPIKPTWFSLDKYYDLNSIENGPIGILELTKVIIHSFVFALVVNDEKGVVIGFVVTSEFRRHEWLYKISLKDFTKIMREVGNNYPNSFHVRFDPKAKEWIVKTE